MILTAKNKPFKLERHALNAIKDKPGYIVVNKDGGFVGVEKKLFDNAITEEVTIPNKSRKIHLVEVEDHSGLDVQCPSCGQSYHSTTEHYNPDIDANPSMLELKEPYKSWGWTQFGNDPGMGYGCLECPDCGAALSPSGTLRIKNV